MSEGERRSGTLIVTPQILPGLLQLLAKKNSNPLRVRWLICEDGSCDRGRNAFTIVNQAHDLCPECGGPCLSMDDYDLVEARPEQSIGRVEVYHGWEPTKKLYRGAAYFQLTAYSPEQHGIYVRYMPRAMVVSERTMSNFLYSVNYQRTCDPDLQISRVGPIEHVLDLSDPIEDLQVSLADLEAAWEANPLCPKQTP